MRLRLYGKALVLASDEGPQYVTVQIRARYCLVLCAKSSCWRTAGQTRFDDLTARAEKLPERTLPTLN